MLWENLREEEFKEAREKANGVCILPIGCLEKHGQHLPLGSDVISASRLAEIAAEKEYAVVFPTMYFGEKTGNAEYDGTVMFSAELRYKILQETCSEIARNGFKKILIFNCHGGNWSMLGNFTRSVYSKKTDYMVYSYGIEGMNLDEVAETAEKYDFLSESDLNQIKKYAEEKLLVGHACMVETAWIYGLRPETVRLDKVDQESGQSIHRFDSFAKKKVLFDLAWLANYPNSYTGGEFKVMTEGIAKAFVKFTSDKLADVIQFLKTETISDEFHKEWLAKQK